jgi:hypothetical protein
MEEEKKADWRPSEIRDFETQALEVFSIQSKENPVYREFLSRTGRFGFKPSSIEEIPFLPVCFFRSHTLLTGRATPRLWFASSGTTGQIRSRHPIPCPDFYLRHSRRLFELALGPPEDYRILALLPGYTENPESSLITMVKHLGGEAGCTFAGADMPRVKQWLENPVSGKKDLVFGVTFALLQLAEQWSPPDFSQVCVVDTGGMKGLGREMCREEIREIILRRLGCSDLWSEYGMTELQSQAYAPDGLHYRPAFSLRALVRPPEDPMGPVQARGRGALNLVDLANSQTISFLATDDVGEVFADGSFRVAGRVDQSEVRGCNLLFAS